MKRIEDFCCAMCSVSIYNIIIALGIIVFVIILNKLLISKIYKIFTYIVSKSNTHIDDSLVKASQKPLKLFILFYGVYQALRIIEFDNLNLNIISTSRLIKLAGVIAMCYFFYNLTLENSILHKSIHNKNDSNGIVFPFVSIIIRIAIVIFAVVIIANEFGFTGFITGLGISGIAFALAAQDTFSNLFGGMVIVLDKPFSIGDWVQTSDIEGVIEEITFRSTKIRTFAEAIVTVPNSKLANSNIINWSQRDKRRIHFKFTLDYSTSIDKINICVQRIEKFLRSNDKIKKEMIIVSFNELSNYGFGIFVYFYTEMMGYEEYEKLKQIVNINILSILREEKVKLFFINFNRLQENILGVNMVDKIEDIGNVTEEEREK